MVALEDINHTDRVGYSWLPKERRDRKEKIRQQSALLLNFLIRLHVTDVQAKSTPLCGPPKKSPNHDRHHHLE